MRISNTFLMVLLMVAAMALVHTTYRSRKAFAQLEKHKALAQELDTDYKRLVAERQKLSQNLQVEQTAKTRLHMIPIDPNANTLVLNAANKGQP